MAHEKAISEGFDALWGKSLERNWILGRLGLPGISPTFNVPDKPGYKYVNKGIEGEEGQVIALDRVGVADIYNQRVRLRREFGEYVIREAEYLDSSGGLSNTLAGLTDVTISSVADGDIIVYDSGSGEWINAAPGVGGGGTYYAGDAIDIDGGNVISVKVNSSSAIVVDGGSNTLLVNVGDGIKIDTNELTLSLASNPGLEYTTSQVRVKAGDGIAVGAGGVALDFATDPGLEISSGKVRVKEYFGIERSSNGIGVRLKTTSGLVVDIGGLAVGAGDGIDVLTSTIAVDVTDFVDTARGLYEPTTNDIGINLATNSGLTFSGGALTLGTPTTLTVATVTNTVTTSTHQHAVTTSTDVGTTPAAAILASTAGGALTLAQLTLRGNLVFAGGDRSITASNTLTISPSTDLILDPTGLILTPNAQSIRTSTINDLPTGIDGFNIFNRYSNYTQLTIGAIKADELYIRVFVADETRIDRGEEYWSKSFGVVETDFSLPAINSTVDVWFEDAPAAVTFNLFAVNDYLLCRTIDWTTGLVVQKIWFQVTASKLAQETTAINGIDRQQWRIKRLQGGSTSLLVKRGNLMLDTGVTGQGWVHLSALSQDGGPFIQMGAMTSVSTVPQFTNYTRMGNLNGTVDYSADTYGFAAGDSLGTTPSGGFSGLTADSANGLRLFNTAIAMYDSGIKEMSITKDYGLRYLEQDTDAFENRKYIGWFSDIDDTTQTSQTAGITSATNIGIGTHILRVVKNAHSSLTDGNSILLLVQTNVPGSIPALGPSISIDYATATGSSISLSATKIISAGLVGIGLTPASPLHVYESTSTTGAAGGVTIQQNSTGDALLQFLLSGGRRWVAGIDNSDGDKFKISNNAALGAGDVLTINTSGNVGIGTTTPTVPLHVAADAIFLATFETLGSTKNAVVSFVAPTGKNTNFAFYEGATLKKELRYDATANGFGIVADDEATFNFFVADATGNAGIGTVTPASPLHVYENTTATTTAAGVTIEQDGTGDARLQFLLTGGQRWGVGIDNSVSDGFVIAPGTDLSTTPALTITTGGITGTGGHLGVGTTTPGVDVISTTDITAGKMIHIDGDTSSAKLVLSADISASINLIGRSGGTGEKWLQISTGSGFSNITSYNDTGANPTSFLVMDHATGYVGINNDSPDARLDVDTDDNNGIRSTVYSATNWFNYGARRANGTQVSPTRALLNTIIGSWGAQGYTLSGWGGVYTAQILMRAAENYTSTAQGSKMQFRVTPNGSTTATDAMEIANDGAVTIPYIWAHAVNGTAVQVDSTGLLTKATSSIRFKKNVREMPGDFGDDFIMALRPIVYNNKYGDDSSDYVGFVAEDVFGIGGKPFISFNNDGLVESLHYDKLTVPLVAAVQDLIPYKARIAELESEMVELRARVNAMEGE